MVCRDFILPEFCKPCLFLSSFQFAKIIVPYLAFRVTPAEAKKIREKVRQSGLSQQEYLLQASLKQPILVIHELKPILAELRAWGRNLNQLTILAHTGHIQTVYLNELTEALGKTYEALNGLLAEKGTVVSSGNL